MAGARPSTSWFSVVRPNVSLRDRRAATVGCRPPGPFRPGLRAGARDRWPSICSAPGTRGVPDDIPHEKPVRHLVESHEHDGRCVARLSRARRPARRVRNRCAVTGFSRNCCRQRFPQRPSWSTGELAMRAAARRIKTDEEVARAARGRSRWPSRGLAAGGGPSWRPEGARADRLRGYCSRPLAAGGVSTPVESGCRLGDFARSPVADQPRPATTGRVNTGDLGGLFRRECWSGGYAGEGGTHLACGCFRWRRHLCTAGGDSLWARLIAACRPGAGGRRVARRLRSGGGSQRPPMPVARGAGAWAFDPPVISKHLPQTAGRRATGAGAWCWPSTGYVWESGRRRRIRAAKRCLSPVDGPEVLTSSPSWAGMSGEARGEPQASPLAGRTVSRPIHRNCGCVLHQVALPTAGADRHQKSRRPEGGSTATVGRLPAAAHPTRRRWRIVQLPGRLQNTAWSPTPEVDEDGPDGLPGCWAAADAVVWSTGSKSG